MATTNSLKNVNFMSQSKYDSIEPSDEELYAIETSKFEQSIRDGIMPDYNTAVTIPTSSTSAPYNCWVEVGVTSANKTAKLYINGREIAVGQGRDDSHDSWYTGYVPKGIKIYQSGSFQRAVYYKLKGES
jgi:hypothetical protein